MTQCVVCQRREAERPMVCQPCRTGLAHDLAEVGRLWALLPAALEPGVSTGQRVSGSREASLPLRIDPLDLSLAAGVPEPVTDPYRDQCGFRPVAGVLDSWARDWQESLWPDHRLPVPTVPSLVGWLSDRLGVVCDRHPAVDEFAAEIRATLAQLRHVHGLVPPEPERIRDVECDRCDRRLLYRRQDGSGDVECHNRACGRVMTAADYTAWTKRLAAFHRGRIAA